MHSMHHHHNRSGTSIHIQRQQSTLATGTDQHLNGNHEHQQQQQQQAGMTVLESLEPVLPTSSQPILSAQDPASSQQVSQLQQSPPIIHHMAQAAPQPHLHILRAPACHQLEQEQLEQQRQSTSSTSSSNTLSARQNHQHQQPQQQQQQRPQLQIDNMVADGGSLITHWLHENYEVADGESLPRSTVYNHYLSHCRKLRISSVNAASFGKMIRSVFAGLKTRRLGTRGHSKYHYFGVRAKQHVRFDWIHPEIDHANRSNDDSRLTRQIMADNGTDNGSESDSTGDFSGRLSSLGCGGSSISNIHSNSNNNNNGTIGTSKRIKRLHESSNDIDFSDHHGHGYTVGSDMGQSMDRHEHFFEEMDHSQQCGSNGGTYCLNGDEIDQDSSGLWPVDQYDLSSFKSHLGGNKDTLVDEHWPQCELGSLESELASRLGSDRAHSSLAEDLSGLVEGFESQYKAYYKRMVDLLGDLNFNDIEHLWSEFWQPPPAPVAHETVQYTGDNDSPNGVNHQQQHHQQQQQMLHTTNLTFNQLYQLTGHPVMIDRINQIDYELYSAIEAFLIPDMLRPMPRPLMQRIRLFARYIGSWTESAIKLYNPKFVSEKMKSVRAFEYALRQCTNINHLSTASLAIWNKRAVLVQMSIDLSRIDLRDIEHQVSLMSQAKLDQLINDSCQDDRLLTAGLQPRTIVPGKNDGAQNRLNDNIENRYMNHENNNRSTASDSNGLQTDSVDHHHPHQDGFCIIQPAQLIQDFLHLLDDPYPANIWPDWCRNLVESRVCGQSFEEARNFILKWNFYISLILRELTLRSAPSLASFQLIRLLFDEYMYHLVVRRLAQAHQKTPTQLLRPSVNFDNF